MARALKSATEHIPGAQLPFLQLQGILRWNEDVCQWSDLLERLEYAKSRGLGEKR